MNNNARLSFYLAPSSFGNFNNQIKPIYNDGSMGVKNELNETKRNVYKPVNTNNEKSGVSMAYNPGKINNSLYSNSNMFINANANEKKQKINNNNNIQPTNNNTNNWNSFGIAPLPAHYVTPPIYCWNNFGGTNYLTAAQTGYCMNQYNGGFSRYVKTNTFAYY
jgi:hypothetical protein